MKFGYRQVVNEYDMWIAMYDYMISQLEGRFRLQFPSCQVVADQLLSDFRSECIRSNLNDMQSALNNAVSIFGASLTKCMLTSCPEHDSHEFLREFINLAWDLRWLTNEWLKEQGVVVGQSQN